MQQLLSQIETCSVCKKFLPRGPRPVVQASSQSRILLIGQAPGRRVHESGIPWDDPSGDRLRRWLQVNKDTFYNPDHFALVPMGFCYPGTGKNGDLPPRPECAPLWHDALLQAMPHIEMTILIGLYAQKYYLKEKGYKTLTDNVRHLDEFLPNYWPVPHPSPRNIAWYKRNPWFEQDLLPALGHRVQEILA